MDCLLQHCFVFLGGYFTGHLPKPTVQNRKNKKNNGRSTPFFLAPLNQVGLPGRVCCINSQWKTLDILDTSHWSNQASITEAHNRSTLESESPPKGLWAPRLLITCAAIICCVHSMCACVQFSFRTRNLAPNCPCFQKASKSCEVKLWLLFCTVPKEIVKPNTLLKQNGTYLGSKSFGKQWNKRLSLSAVWFWCRGFAILRPFLYALEARQAASPCLPYTSPGKFEDQIFHPAKRKLIFPPRGRGRWSYFPGMYLHSQQKSFGAKKMPWHDILAAMQCNAATPFAWHLVLLHPPRRPVSSKKTMAAMDTPYRSSLPCLRCHKLDIFTLENGWTRWKMLQLNVSHGI